MSPFVDLKMNFILKYLYTSSKLKKSNFEIAYWRFAMTSET